MISYLGEFRQINLSRGSTLVDLLFHPFRLYTPPDSHRQRLCDEVIRKRQRDVSGRRRPTTRRGSGGIPVGSEQMYREDGEKKRFYYSQQDLFCYGQPIIQHICYNIINVACTYCTVVTYRLWGTLHNTINAMILSDTNATPTSRSRSRSRTEKYRQRRRRRRRLSILLLKERLLVDWYYIIRYPPKSSYYLCYITSSDILLYVNCVQLSFVILGKGDQGLCEPFSQMECRDLCEPFYQREERGLCEAFRTIYARRACQRKPFFIRSKFDDEPLEKTCF